MTTLKLPSRDEIHAAYLLGEEGVVALIAQLVSDFVTILRQQQEMAHKQRASGAAVCPLPGFAG